MKNLNHSMNRLQKLLHNIDKIVLYKAISYRIIVLLVTIPWVGFHTAIGLSIMMTILYYIHEKVWQKFK